MTRDQGLEIVHYYENQQPKGIELFCRWLGVDERSLLFAANRHRNKKYWSEVEPDVWVKNDNPKKHNSKPPSHPNLTYPPSTDQLNDTNSLGYITIGKGVDWPEKPDIKAKSWL